MLKIILASQSAQRLAILRTLPYSVEAYPANIDEQAIPFQSPQQKAERIALAKATAGKKLFPRDLVVAADTFCLCEGKILEKPKSLREAEAMLAWQSGKLLEVLTGYAFFGQKSSLVSGVVTTSVKMRPLRQQEIVQYCQSQPVLTWSGAFSPAYDAGMALIAEISGNATAFSHGFPLDVFLHYLAEQNSGDLAVNNENH